jgi:hypothetical protein
MNKDEFDAIMKGPYKRAVQEERIRRRELHQRRDSEDDDDFRRATNQRMEETKHDSRRGQKDDRRPTRDDRDYHKAPDKDTKDSQRHSQRDSQRSLVVIDDIKRKIKNFMIKDGISLSLFYEYIDKDGDKRLDMNEFREKLGKVIDDFTPSESETLFRY